MQPLPKNKHTSTAHRIIGRGFTPAGVHIGRGLHQHIGMGFTSAGVSRWQGFHTGRGSHRQGFTPAWGSHRHGVYTNTSAGVYTACLHCCHPYGVPSCRQSPERTTRTQAGDDSPCSQRRQPYNHQQKKATRRPPPCSRSYVGCYGWGT